MDEVVIREAVGEIELEWVRGLMREYGAYLEGSGHPGTGAGICIEGYEDELAGLPGVYGAPGGTLLLALRDGVPVGCCAVKPVKAPKDGERSCEMKRLWVGPGARGLGLGRRLVESAIGWARGAGYMAICLDTAPAVMPEANRLYGALGFSEVERFNDNPVPGIVFYRLELA